MGNGCVKWTSELISVTVVIFDFLIYTSRQNKRNFRFSLPKSLTFRTMMDNIYFEFKKLKSETFREGSSDYSLSVTIEILSNFEVDIAQYGP